MSTPLHTISTTDLINEIMTRYDEVLFIGCSQRPNITHCTQPPAPLIDVNSKLDKTTGMASTLTIVLHNILDNKKITKQMVPTN